MHLYSTADVLDYLAVRVNGPRAAQANLLVGIALSDTGENVALHLARGVLNYEFGPSRSAPAFTITTARSVFDALISGELVLANAGQGQLTTADDAAVWTEFTALLDDFTADFPIVTRPQ